VAGVVVTCPFNPRFLLRDGDDVAWYLSNVGDTNFDGGAGKDDLYTGASLDAHADGGSGDDIVFVSAGLTGYGSGQGGDDEVGGGGRTDGATVLDGGTGDDLLAHPVSVGATLTGGSGDDSIVGGSIASGVANGGGGDDVIAFGDLDDPPASSHGIGPTTGSWTIDGGGGADLIAPHRTPDVIHGGAGRDRIDALDGTRDTIDCGDGKDMVWADASDVVAPDCEQRLSTPAPDFAEVDDALARAHALLTRPHLFPPVAAL
jgi:hypothetical protein